MLQVGPDCPQSEPERGQPKPHPPERRLVVARSTHESFEGKGGCSARGLWEAGAGQARFTHTAARESDHREEEVSRRGLGKIFCSAS